MRVTLILLVAALLYINIAEGYFHHLKLEKDKRKQFFIENFGYRKGGKLKLNVTKFEVINTKDNNNRLKPSEYQQDVFFFQTVRESDTAEYLQENADGFPCGKPGYFSADVGDGIFPVDGPETYHNWEETPHYETEIVEPKLYNLFFVNCKNTDGYAVTLDLTLEQYNTINGNDQLRDYLPVGYSPLPSLYFAFSVVYAVMFVVWIFGYIRGKGTVVNKIHHMMSVLVVLKFLALLFYAIEQHFVKIDGKPGGWVIAYYIFAALKTGFFFMIVTLLGTGWNFFKPFLSDKDKKIIMIVIPLQILDNVAMIIIGNPGATEPGATGWLTWMNIFRIVDIICCGAVLIPIIWSIKHLREASQSDGKAARNLQKLQLFRQFYLIVVSYIYFTRIIVYLLDATLPYDRLWLGDFFTELATLIFFGVVGYKFRPVQGNPYFSLEDDDAVRTEEMRATLEE